VRARVVPLVAVISLVSTLVGTATAANPPARPMTRLPAAEGDTPEEQRREVKSLSPLEEDGLTRALAKGVISEATYALQRARSLFHLDLVRERFGQVARPGPRDATLVIRDLVLRYPELSPAEMSVADSILARPTDGASDPEGHGYTVPEAPPVCSTHACFHYVTSTNDAPPLDDTDANGVPDWVDATSATLETVWAKEVTQYGYRPPKSDLTSTNHGLTERSISTLPTSATKDSTGTAGRMIRMPSMRPTCTGTSRPTVWSTTTCCRCRRAAFRL
jgi:hypothetical protein